MEGCQFFGEIHQSSKSCADVDDCVGLGPSCKIPKPRHPRTKTTTAEMTQWFVWMCFFAACRYIFERKCVLRVLLVRKSQDTSIKQRQWAWFVSTECSCKKRSAPPVAVSVSDSRGNSTRCSVGYCVRYLLLLLCVSTMRGVANWEVVEIRVCLWNTTTARFRCC